MKEYPYFESILSPEKAIPLRRKIVRRYFQILTFRALLRVLWRNHFAFDLRFTDKLVALSLISTSVSAFQVAEKLIFHKQVKATNLAGPPVFILGHWRNGTTHLHNLMTHDDNFTYAQTYQFLFPGSFLLRSTQKLAQRMDRINPLKTRQVDNIRFGMYEAAEDELILVALTGISPFVSFMFPRRLRTKYQYHYTDFQSDTDKEVWSKAMIMLLKRITFLRNRPVLLKSPTHTARIKVLLNLFPQAKFIHIIRNPYDVFASNLKLWRDIYSHKFLQKTTQAEIAQIILSIYERMYKIYHKEKSLIPQGHLVEITYEALEKDPLACLNTIYDQLELSDFDTFSIRAKAYLSRIKGYKKNEFRIPEEVKKIVRRRWASNFQLFGYKE